MKIEDMLWEIELHLTKLFKNSATIKVSSISQVMKDPVGWEWSLSVGPIGRPQYLFRADTIDDVCHNAYFAVCYSKSLREFEKKIKTKVYS